MDAKTGGFAAAPRLRRELSSFGVLLLTLSALSPVFSVFGVGAQVLQQAGTGAAWLFLVALLAALVWAVVYAELGSAFPYAGGDYVGVGSILGGWAGAVTLAIWASATGPVNAFEAQIIADYAGPLCPGVPAPVIIYGAVAAAAAVALLAVRFGALMTGLFMALEMAAILALIAAGLWHPARGLQEVLMHPVMPGGGAALIPVTFAAFALAFASTVFGTVGGNQALYFGEELINPHLRMGRVVIIACMLGAVATALPVIALTLGAGNLAAVLNDPAPFSAFMAAKAGPWAGAALGAGVALALFNALIAQMMFGARLLYSLGRDRALVEPINRLLGQVHGGSGVPRFATVTAGVYSAACCLLTSHALLIFITGLLVYGWPLVCVAVLVGRARGQTGAAGFWRAPLHPLGPVLGLLMAVMFAVADFADPGAGRPSLIVMGVVVAAAALWFHAVLRRRPGGWAPFLAKPER